jgi:hypothetical protein
MLRTVLAVMAFCLFTAPAAAAVDARQELMTAIRLLQARHINSAKPDWPAVTAQAEAMLAGEQPQDAYPAIRFVIAALGERHTFLKSADAMAARQTGQRVGNAVPPPLVLPTGSLMGADVGLVALKGISDPRIASIRAYAMAARDALARLADAHVCRIVIDLRGNTGGNMYPMIYGLAPLLGREPYGYFFDVSGMATPWQIAGTMRGRGIDLDNDQGPLQMHARVAVLIDRRTASAAEDTAIAFKSRAGTRFFGENSAGFLTGNISVPLPDGAMLAISTSLLGDRSGARYDDRLVPDQVTPPGDETLKAAMAWLRAQNCDNN